MATGNGETVNEYDGHGMTPLLYAVFAGDRDAVQMLLAQGADCNKPQRDDATATPLWHAQEDFGLTEISALLKEYGARIG